MEGTTKLFSLWNDFFLISTVYIRAGRKHPKWTNPRRSHDTRGDNEDKADEHGSNGQDITGSTGGIWYLTKRQAWDSEARRRMRKSEEEARQEMRRRGQEDTTGMCKRERGRKETDDESGEQWWLHLNTLACTAHAFSPARQKRVCVSPGF